MCSSSIEYIVKIKDDEKTSVQEADLRSHLQKHNKINWFLIRRLSGGDITKTQRSNSLLNRSTFSTVGYRQSSDGNAWFTFRVRGLPVGNISVWLFYVDEAMAYSWTLQDRQEIKLALLCYKNLPRSYSPVLFYTSNVYAIWMVSFAI